MKSTWQKFQVRYSSSPSSKRWIARQDRDQFVKKALSQNYRARSAFKLLELDQKYNFIKPGSVFIDCGAAPGGWSQVVSRKTKLNGNLIIAVDLLTIEPIPGVNVIQGDFTHISTQQKVKELLKEREADVILSDMAPNFSGQRFIDHVKSMELCEFSLNFAERVLKSGGTFLCKFLMGESDHEFRNNLKTKFDIVRHEKPQAVRKKSTEGYFMCLGYKKNK
ncbi:cell division protein FtsJ [Rhizophagus irregularis]|uniref:rRNA methyltransferase 2, mitochondrial n=2 Tax=Rhizophagus irregularis TaxID=588596 RepID=U9T096_RHIID|nr:cell division protein FtsJ [Rhizophagus irregularis DAOM 181602=DAOM 197198]PKC14852.1 cell division protein FtsJ [Rhizophagus irregularis]PKC75256.1 cell division protein FtsJ [Rhizophagus irregularis]PKY43527.1 cell division protein FtsJ [Rhizophagus irregularis]POG74222.1 cell division protein FtsJ [Rhizophagus irregularis DAOM 181602=DAOM 197198]|eukprot:XP_025181088.1 cell division protein FtsJ [Rhizophagus irregularis DAOM 181602=DAOM 197198]